MSQLSQANLESHYSMSIQKKCSFIGSRHSFANNINRQQSGEYNTTSPMTTSNRRFGQKMSFTQNMHEEKKFKMNTNKVFSDLQSRTSL